MRKIFIADAHLQRETDGNYRLLMEFLAGLRGNTSTLYILGDLFEFWIGYRAVPFTHYLPLLEELRRLAAAGVEIVYFEGNHDFHMGPFFTETLGARVNRGPAIVDLGGKRAYLCHGDQINTRDYGYRLLRMILHNPLAGVVVRMVPPPVVSAIARLMGRSSKRNHGRRELTWDYAAIVREFAAARFREGCDVVITGHFHLPLLEKQENGTGGTLLSLGDWITHFTYGEWLNDELTLKRYR